MDSVDDITAAVLADPVVGRHVMASEAAVMLQSRTECEQQHARLERWYHRLSVSAYVDGGAFTLIPVAIIAGMAALNQSGSALLQHSGMFVLFIAWGMSIPLVTANLIGLEILKGRINAHPVSLLKRFAGSYLPQIGTSKTDNGVSIGLQGRNGKYYTKRHFATDEETAALEYLVELESIVHTVTAKRQEQFLIASAQPQQKTLEPPREEQLHLFSPSAIVARNTVDISAIDELYETVLEQRSAALIQ